MSEKKIIDFEDWRRNCQKECFYKQAGACCAENCCAWLCLPDVPDVNKELLEALKELEELDRCPVCNRLSGSTHDKDCFLGNAIKQAESLCPVDHTQKPLCTENCEISYTKEAEGGE